MKKQKSFLPTLLLIALPAILAACASDTFRPNSPEREYQRAMSRKGLQLPPEISDINREQLYVVPDNTGRIGRNTLLPSGQNVKFVRDGQLSWLEIGVAAEALWPQMVRFVMQQRMEIKLNQPNSGLLITEWRVRPSELEKDGLFSKLIGGLGKQKSEVIESYRLRLERDGDASRVFADYRSTTKEKAKQSSNDFINQDPELTAELLAQLLVFLGVDQQRAKNLISDAQATAVYSDIHVARTEQNESYLLIWKSYPRSFNGVAVVLDEMGFEIKDRDDAAGFIRFEAGKRVAGQASRIAAKLGQDQPLLEKVYRHMQRSIESKELTYYLQFYRLDEGAIALAAIHSDGTQLAVDDSHVLMQILMHQLSQA